MSDLDIDMVRYMSATDDKCEFSLEDVRTLAREVIRHRDAVAADRERVRTVLEEIVKDVLWPSDFRWVRDEVANTIATRASDQLATAATKSSLAERRASRGFAVPSSEERSETLADNLSASPGPGVMDVHRVTSYGATVTPPLRTSPAAQAIVDEIMAESTQKSMMKRRLVTAAELSEQQKLDVSNAVSDLENGTRGRMPYDLTIRDILLAYLTAPDQLTTVDDLTKREMELVVMALKDYKATKPAIWEQWQAIDRLITRGTR